MSKIQSILALLLFLIILFSMDMIFGNSLKETFSNSNKVGLAGGRDIGLDNIGKKLDYKIQFNTNRLSGNMIYSGSGFLGATSPYPKGDDQPLYFGFSSQ